MMSPGLPWKSTASMRKTCCTCLFSIISKRKTDKSLSCSENTFSGYFSLSFSATSIPKESSALSIFPRQMMANFSISD